MRIFIEVDENEKCTPINFASTLIECGVFLDVVELEEIAEHLLVYCNKKKVKVSNENQT